ncbi:hypothetical protein [Myxosarcina sp. GI1]|uniref:hypothetical protein n=1 Tax=Myxosarcina sp. GI1 TaxID=1541065 RepID=UPI00055EE345|nr:hypothetical protein [Myxosarcina sp. GI1]
MTIEALTTERTISKLVLLEDAIAKLLNRQEKDWGCFQVVKEGDFYSLYIPSLASLKLYQSSKSIVYKGYWWHEREDTLPDIKDRSEKPDIYLRKKRKEVPDKKNPRLIKQQRIFEIYYRYNSCPEVRRLNQIITRAIGDRILSSVTISPAEELVPLILISEAD